MRRVSASNLRHQRGEAAECRHNDAGQRSGLRYDFYGFPDLLRFDHFDLSIAFIGSTASLPDTRSTQPTGSTRLNDPRDTTDRVDVPANFLPPPPVSLRPSDVPVQSGAPGATGTPVQPSCRTGLYDGTPKLLRSILALPMSGSSTITAVSTSRCPLNRPCNPRPPGVSTPPARPAAGLPVL